MTRKENLLIEIYNLRNQISEIKGNTIVNIEEFSQTRKFRDEAAEWKEFEFDLFPASSLIAELARLAKLLDVYDRIALNLGNLVAKVVNLN